VIAIAYRDFMERAALRRSLWLDVGRPDHPAPLFSFVGDELAERGGCGDEWYRSKIGLARLDLGVGEAGANETEKLGKVVRFANIKPE
jgi:hypothetical protein